MARLPRRVPSSAHFGHFVFRLLPKGPRCRLCSVPFAGVGPLLLGPFGFTPWTKNPNLCSRCVTWLSTKDVSGAEIELSFLFADVRRSSDIARQIGTMEFARLMQRFYRVATDNAPRRRRDRGEVRGGRGRGVLHAAHGGGDHAAAAVRAAEHLLAATGHGDDDGPWLPLGAGCTRARRSSGWCRAGQRATSRPWEMRSTSPPTSPPKRGRRDPGHRCSGSRFADRPRWARTQDLSLKGHPSTRSWSRFRRQRPPDRPHLLPIADTARGSRRGRSRAVLAGSPRSAADRSTARGRARHRRGRRCGARS